MWFLKTQAGNILLENTSMNKKYTQSYSQLDACIHFFQVLNIVIICNNKFPPPSQFRNTNFPAKVPK